jgi:ankyrin repeat protein
MQLAELISRALQDTLTADDIADLPPTLAGDLLSYFAANEEGSIVGKLIGLGAPVDAPNSRGTNALIVAIAADRLEIARQLLHSGANPTIATRDGTPGEFARNIGSREMALLVADEAPPTDEDLLRRAARSNDVTEISRLLAAGVDVDAADTDGVTALLDAAVAGAGDAVRHLADAGADLNVVAADGNSAVGVAVMSGNQALARLLLLSGARADGEVSGVPYLTLAAMAGDMEMVELLIRGGANPQRMDNDGVRPAAIARLLGYDEIAERLGGAPELDSPPDLASLASNRMSQAFREALDAGADPNALDPEGTPVAILVAANGSAEMLRQLHAAGGDLSATGPDGNNVLHAALVNRSVVQRPRLIAAALQLSKDGGAQLLAHRNAEGRSAFVALAVNLKGSEAASVGQQLLPSAVALASQPDPDGVTPLIAAVIADNGAFVAELVAKGASTTQASGAQTLQEIARARGAWSALLVLPDDRALPAGLKKGASRDVKMQLQQRLKDWGYYSGSIDGIFGAGSRAAMIAFLKDRDAELRRLPVGDSRLSIYEAAATADNNATYSLTLHTGSGCNWRLVDWDVPAGSGTSSRFIGCVEGGDDAWNANGVGYVEYEGGGHDLHLFGPTGWGDATDL